MQKFDVNINRVFVLKKYQVCAKSWKERTEKIFRIDHWLLCKNMGYKDWLPGKRFTYVYNVTWSFSFSLSISGTKAGITFLVLKITQKKRHKCRENRMSLSLITAEIQWTLYSHSWNTLYLFVIVVKIIQYVVAIRRKTFFSIG